MSMMMRRGMMVPKAPGGLPSEYLQVQYLECTGTQYIATNYVPTADNTDINLDFAFTVQQSGDQMLFGSYVNGTSKTWQCELYNARSWYVGTGKNQFRNVGSITNISLNTKYTMISNDTELNIVGGTAVTANYTRTSGNTRPIYIFAYNNSSEGTPGNIHQGARVYRLTFKENGVASADFVPCIRISDSKPGMYDLVGRQFYVNQGTGEFIAGLAPDLSDTDYWSIAGYFNAGGNIVANPGYLMCDYQPIISGNTYTLNTAGNTWKGLAYYDEQYNTLDFSQNANYTTPITLTAPSNSKYYRAYFGTDSTGIKFELVNPT